MKKRIISLSVLFLLTIVLSACGTKSIFTKETYEVTDSRGVVISFESVPEKVISLLPSNTEIIYELGEGEKLIAVSTYCNYPEDTANKPKIAAGVDTNIEEIISMAPDLVIFGMMVQTEAQIDLLQKAGINAVVTNASSIADTYIIIDMLGQVFNKEKEASSIIDDMKTSFEEIRQTVSSYSSKKVYIEISPLEYGLWTCGKGTFQDELITLVGSENIFSDIEGWGQVSEEQVISRDPDIIFSTVGTLFDSSLTINEITARSNWADIGAVKEQKVFVVDSDAIQRPGPRLVQAAKDLVQYIYIK